MLTICMHVVNTLLHKVSLTRIYPKYKAQILLTINVSTKTRFTRLLSRELSTPLPLGVILLAIDVNVDTSY